MYTLIAVVSLFALAVAPVLAYNQGPSRDRDNSENSVTVINTNDASICNDVEVSAETGENTAGGSYSGDGGNSGSLRSGGEIEDSSTGNGGNGGNSGLGGEVQSGDAYATANLLNMANSNDTAITTCSTCDQQQRERDRHQSDNNSSGSEVLVVNANDARLHNSVEVEAETGENVARGSSAGDGGTSGEIASMGFFGEVEDSDTGNGGNGGNSSDGGLVVSGEAVSVANVVNMVNENVTRIKPASSHRAPR